VGDVALDQGLQQNLGTIIQHGFRIVVRRAGGATPAWAKPPEFAPPCGVILRMSSLSSCRFHHAALVGKYQARGIRPVLEDVAYLLARAGLDVSLERETAMNTGMTEYPSLSIAEIGR